MKVEILLVLILGAEFLRQLRRLVADRHQLHPQNVVLARFRRSEEIADAEFSAALLAREREAEMFARASVRDDLLRVVDAAGAFRLLELFRVLDDQVSAPRLNREV